MSAGNIFSLLDLVRFNTFLNVLRAPFYAFSEDDLSDDSYDDDDDNGWFGNDDDDEEEGDDDDDVDDGGNWFDNENEWDNY